MRKLISLVLLSLSSSLCSASSISTAATESVDSNWYKSGSSTSAVTEEFKGTTVNFTFMAEESYIYTDFQSRCPSGYVANGSVCRKTVTAPVSEVCVLGKPPASGCIPNPSTSPKVNGCGWHLTMCGASHSAQVSEQWLSVPKTKTCPENYSMIGNSCKKILTTNIERYCPSGYHQYEGRCRKRK